MNNMRSSLRQFEVLQRASLFLEKHYREPKVAEMLLQHHLQVSRSQFYTMMHDSVPPSVIAKFKADIEKHAATGVPIQHLTGYESFYGREFGVDEHVLIPRPETEELVQHIIKTAGDAPITIADIGTGSGIIAITLKLELPHAKVYATDISEQALQAAERNAEELGAEVSFLQGDFLQPLIDRHIKADIIVSNPPYIARAEERLLADTVKNFDPALALFAEENGLAAYRKLITSSPAVIEADGILAFEIGHDQGQAVASLLKRQFPDSNIQVLRDINGKDRIVTGECHPLL